MQMIAPMGTPTINPTQNIGPPLYSILWNALELAIIQGCLFPEPKGQDKPAKNYKCADYCDHLNLPLITPMIFVARKGLGDKQSPPPIPRFQVHVENIHLAGL
jgi:hypothetical protein